MQNAGSNSDFGNYCQRSETEVCLVYIRELIVSGSGLNVSMVE